jgi:hypothetical protein
VSRILLEVECRPSLVRQVSIRKQGCGEERIVQSEMSGATSPANSTAMPAARWLLPLVAIGLAGFFAVLQLSKWPAKFHYPGEEDFVEGTQLAEMLHLRQGRRIYDPPSAGRFDGAIYGPLFYLSGARLVDPDKPAYTPLRVISFLATLGLAAECAVLAFWLSQSAFAAILAPLLFFSNAFVARYGVSARGDMVSLLLAFTGFLLAFRLRHSRALLFSAPLMLLTIFYKQQFLAGPLAVFLFLLLEKRHRHAAEFAGMLAAGGLALLAFFTWVVFPHQAFPLHFLSYNRLPFDEGILLRVSLGFAVALSVPLVGALKFLTRQPNRLLACYAGSAVVVYSLIGFLSGASTNRCLECVVVLYILFVAQVATARSLISAAVWTGALGMALAVNLLFFVPRSKPADLVQDSALQEYLRSQFPPGTPCLTYYAGDPIRAGLDAPVTNLWHYAALIRTGALSDHDIVAHIERGRYGVILLDFDLRHPKSSEVADYYLTQPVRNAILGSYELAMQFSIPRPERNGVGDGQVYAWIPRTASSHIGANQDQQNR